jgi:feruloyl-CoA synthase
VATVGQRIPITSAYGSTETTAGCLAVHFASDRVGIGLPMPGVTVKLVPVDTRYEIRIAGPVVTPGYLRDPERTRAAFDDEGYFCLGDLVTFHDPAMPEQGLAFAGRMAEEFKLGSGTWVSAGSLRASVLQALAPWVAEAVICGDGRNEIGVLAWPDRAALQRDLGLAADVALDSAGAAALQGALRARLAAYNAANPGASTRIARYAWLSAPPALAVGELSDKGTINRGAVLRHRAADVERLYEGGPGVLLA